jgi:hypothetical protein
MASARPGPLDRIPGAAGKAGFAKRVRGFAKRVAALPGFPTLWIISLTVALVMAVTGAFNTSALPVAQRLGFWLLLFAWNSLKWQTWFAFTVRRPEDWGRAAIVGGVVLNVPLPFEIGIVLAIVGIDAALSAPDIWLRAALISAAVFPAMWLISHFVTHRVAVRPAAPPAPGGLLDRARVVSEALTAIEAEDQYCRVRRSDGSAALIHYRFGDALGEVAGLDGAQVHRGAWVAASAVTGAAREGRRWHLRLADGSKIAVSAPYLAEVRARGWLAR